MLSGARPALPPQRADTGRAGGPGFWVRGVENLP